ncbi:MAG: efflux RND transporter permease subunit, partial [Rhizobiaceae bacterium]
GTSIAYYIFRSFLSAFICAIPPTLTSLWSLGLFGYLQVPITYLTTVLPTLALILAFADGIVLYFRWQSSNADSPDLDINLLRAIRDVGPASALTSITTVLAFLSFSFASGTALKEFSALGMAVVSMAFFAVIIGLPLAIHWAIVLGIVKPGKVRKPAFQGIGERLFGIVIPRSGAISIAAIVMVLALGIVHFFVTPEFRITDYLPKNSETRNAEELTNSVAGGRSPIFVSLPKAKDGPALTDANLERLRLVQDLLADIYGRDRVFSLAEIAERLETDQAKERLSEQIETALSETRSTFVSRDGKNMLVTVYIPSDQAIAQTLEQISQTRDRLAATGWADEAVVTGFDVLMADEFTRLVEQLRTSLLLAIFLGVMIIGIATRSPVLTAAAITPNLLPILAVELVVWLKGGTVNLSEVIALTISFGIAIDNAVHVINFYNREIKAGRTVEDAVSGAVKEVAPALAASTAILCASCLVTQMSILPVVPVLGRLMIATLLFAYIANLLILPANILSINRLLNRSSGHRAEKRGES